METSKVRQTVKNWHKNYLNVSLFLVIITLRSNMNRNKMYIKRGIYYMSRLTIFIWYCTPPDFEFLKCEIMLSYKCNHLIFLCGVSEHFTQLKIPDQCLHLRERLSMQFYKYNLFQLAPCFYKYLAVTTMTENKLSGTPWRGSRCCTANVEISNLPLSF